MIIKIYCDFVLEEYRDKLVEYPNYRLHASLDPNEYPPMFLEFVEQAIKMKIIHKKERFNFFNIDLNS